MIGTPFAVAATIVLTFILKERAAEFAEGHTG